MNNLSKKPFNGYLGQLPKLPLYESVCIDDLLQPGSVETFANIFWPQGNPDFCNVVKSYSKPLVELDEMVKRMVLEGLGLKNYIDEFLDLSSFLLRLTNYKAAQCEDMINTPGIGDHTDGNFLTIISQNQVNGLQILKKNGEWIDVNISSNSFVVLSGDSFMAWTNGRLHSPLHKVTMAGDSDRFSIQLFSDPKSDCTIKAQKNLWMRNTLYSSSHMTFLDILSFLRQKLDGKLAPMFSRFIVVYELLYFLKLQLAKGLSEKTSYDRSKVCETILNMLL